jgi:ATP-binding cassette subfamily C (CFTR/MRP) protein 2
MCIIMFLFAIQGLKSKETRIMEDLWTIFCGLSGCADAGGKPCSSNFEFLSHPSSCINHILIICFNILLLVMLIFNMIRKSSSKTVHIRARFLGFSNLQMVSAIVNGCLGFVYLCLGIWNLEEKLRKTKTALPLNWWLLVLVQGFTWLLISLTVSLKGNKLPRSPLRLLTILSFLFAGIVCALSLLSAILSKEVSIKVALDMLSFPGAILLMFCTFKGYKYQASDEGVDESSLYTPLNGEASDVSKSDSVGLVTLFAKAGFFSRISFWWLNPLMKRGRERTLEDEDIPKLREADRAESCYLLFLEQLNKLIQAEPSSQPSILRTIIVCHWKEILKSGFFALLKILTLSAGPVLLNAFILVAEGKESFKYEGYVLAITLFISKCIESVSQRQWYFRSRLIGLKVRSLLTAAIYKKQLRLSNAAKLTHSGGEIMNYVTVDAYRIGEFPFWFHQTWTTSLQLCIALVILYRAVGLATFAALVVVVLTVLCNAPLAKLQHKFQSQLMVAQDERLRASSEALINMKVLKLYAWETHFKTAIENLRKVEYKWLSAVQSRKAYNGFLLWTSPVLVSAATFGACYFLKIPLHANNVFTFVATLCLVQDPVSSIPDVIGVVIQAKVAFKRILKFLEAPELQSANVRRKTTTESVNVAISIKSANFAWEENSSKPTLRDINLEVRPGEKVAICGEVGSGKSTLLAAILGEVPNIQGTVSSYCYFPSFLWLPDIFQPLQSCLLS